MAYWALPYWPGGTVLEVCMDPLRSITMALVSVQTCNVPNVGHIQTGLGMKFLYVMCIVTMVT